MQTHIISPDFLYRIEEAQDLFADACVCDESNHLIFLSIWGRDTATQEFLARLTLGTGEHGLDRFHLVTIDATSIPVAVANAHTLEKRTTRAFQQTLFGSMVHVWLLDPRCVRPDKSNGSALAILPKGDAHSTERLWSLVQDACPLPLLPHWRDTTLNLLREREMLTRLAFALGEVEGYRVALNIPALIPAIGALIRSGSLRTEESPLPAESPLAKVA